MAVGSGWAGEVLALLPAQHRIGDREAPIVERSSPVVPAEPGNPAGDGVVQRLGHRFLATSRTVVARHVTHLTSDRRETRGSV
jgi:hypothetical protein